MPHANEAAWELGSGRVCEGRDLAPSPPHTATQAYRGDRGPVLGPLAPGPGFPRMGGHRQGYFCLEELGLAPGFRGFGRKCWETLGKVRGGHSEPRIRLSPNAGSSPLLWLKPLSSQELFSPDAALPMQEMQEG